MVFIAYCNVSMSANNIRGVFTMRFTYLIFLLFATAFFQPHASAQEPDPIGSVDAVFGAVEDKAIVIGSLDGEIPSGVYPATIEDVNGFLAVIDVEVDGDLNTVFGYIPSALIPNDGTPMQMNVYSDDSYSSFVSLLVFAADPPVYPGTPHQPKKANEPYDPTKVPVFRGGESFLPLKKGEIEVDENGNVKINTKGPSINTNPADPNVKKNGPHQVISIPEGLEIIQQGVNPDGSLKTHGVVRPTKPMKPEDFEALLKGIKVKPFELPKE